MLAPWKKIYDQPRQHIKKQRYHFANKGLYSQGYGLISSHVYRCESLTVKKAERWRTDAFELWCWRRLLRVPWTARRSHQSILKEINPEYSLEELILKIQYFGHLIQSVDSLEKTPCLERFRLGGKGGNRGWDGWMASLTQWTWIWANSGRQRRMGDPGVLQSMGLQRVRHDLTTEHQCVVFNIFSRNWIWVLHILTFNFHNNHTD